MTLRMDGILEFTIEGMQNPHRTPIISVLKASRLLRQGCRGFITTVLGKDEIEVKIENIPVVKKYPNVFPKDISGLPLDRKVELTIDVLPGNAPISKAPYRMDPTEMKELKFNCKSYWIKDSLGPVRHHGGHSCYL